MSKTFPGVKALRKVDLDVSRGEVLALAGENGAGKSTLMKIMTGVFRADPGGAILIEGNPVEIHDPVHARALGINIIYQELSTVENLSVAENVFLAREPLRRGGLIDKARMRRDARGVLARLDIDMDPATPMRDLSIGQKQMVEVAKAIASDAKVIVMDEPTASLSHHEAATLLRLVRQLAANGIGLIYISHRLDELFEVADRVTVLRDGATVGTLPIAEVTRETLVRMMVDRDLAQLYAVHASSAGTRVLLEVDGLTLRNPTAHQPKVRDVSFALRAGEVLGFFGLVGAGRTEIMEMIFGMRPHDGRIRVAGEDARIAKPGDAIARGIGFVT